MDTIPKHTPPPHIGVEHFTVELNVTCPHCEHTFDVTANDDFWEHFPANYMVCTEQKNVKAYCMECFKEFIFDVGSGQ